MASDKPWKPAGDTTAGAGLTLEARRAFLQLPAEDRRYLLTKMAADPGLIAHYQHEADLERQLAEVRGELAWALAGADADAVELGNLDRQCQSQRRMIAHLRDRLAKCQEHNRRLVQEAREAYRHVDSIIRRCGEEVAETERQLAECQAQAAEWRAIENKAQELVQSRDEKLAELQALKQEIIDRTGIGSESNSRLIDMVRQLLDRYEECQAQAAAMRERLQKAKALEQEIKRIKIAWGRAMSVLKFFGAGVGMPDCSTCPDPDCDDGPCEEKETALAVMRDEWNAVENDKDGVAAWEKWRQLEAVEGVRPEILAFAQLMERKIREHQKKHVGCPGWKKTPIPELAGGLCGEIGELGKAIADGDMPMVALEAADVANYAMFIADVAGGLGQPVAQAALASDEPTVAPPNTGWQQDYGRGVEEKESC